MEIIKVGYSLFYNTDFLVMILNRSLYRTALIKRIIAVFLVFSTLQVHAQSKDSWTIPADHIDPANYYGVTVANGVIGLVASPEPMKVKDVVLNGVYDYYQRGRVSNILKTFNHINLTLSVDGQTIGQDNSSNYRQTLNMRKAELITAFDVAGKASVTHTLMALRSLPYTSMAIVTIQAKKELRIAATSVIEAPDHLQQVQNLYSQIEPHIALLTSVAKSPSGKHTVAACNSIIFTEPAGQQPQVVHREWDYNRHGAQFEKRIRAGQVYSFAIVASATSTEQYKDPRNEAERLTIFANLQGIKKLQEQHEAAWQQLWKSDIVVEGDEAAQRDIHAALYHLYSFSRAGTAYSPSPMGLSGLGYNGHVFWDSELWMYPPLLVLHPEIAWSMLEYRFQRLNAAKQNALAHGYKGAMFPWESSDEGLEDTPVWALTGPFQHHITGDVGWAFWKYYQVTKDKNWLRERGYPILKEVADFWASRVERKGPGNYQINNVIGANEWQENIDNNAFTNGIAITTLHYATQAAKELGAEPDPDWEQVAQNIPILKFPDGVTCENASYNGVDIKQADVNLLAYPLDIVSDRSQIVKDLDYYEPRMSADGPAMGNATLATLYSRLGNARKAYELFLKSYKPNEVPPFGVLAETQGGTNPYFATGAGGMLQAVIFGFGGLQFSDQGMIQLKTALPVKWKSITIKGAGIPKKDFVNHNGNTGK